MAGHSKFKNIMHRKGRQDAVRSKMFAKLSKEITVASKLGGPDPDGNPRLRLAIQNAKGQSMPKDNIQRAVDKGSANEGDDFFEIRYEGYGPGGVAVIVEALSDKSGTRFSQLTVGYRLPQPTMDVANRLLRETQFGFNPPIAVREVGDEPRFVHVETPARLSATVVALVRSELEKLGSGYLAVIVPDAYLDVMSDSLHSSGIEHGLVDAGALENQTTLVPVSLVKGLEVDAAIVVEPEKIISGERNGIRALYVALTRATQRLTIVHAYPLPHSLTADI